LSTATPIQFFFDFSSPYGYLAATQIDALAARFGRSVDWRPILLGVVMRVTGGKPLTEVPLKGDYSRHDFARSARFLGVPFAMPTPFPIATQTPARAFYWLNESDPESARRFALAAYRAYFVAGRDISLLETTLAVAAETFTETLPKAWRAEQSEALAEGIASPAIKERLKHECAAALATGVFGSPFFNVDGEAFFGADRLPQLERWLATGGF
jgi:2-hydroxychromene-2-carboxylate isomerase